MSGSNGGVRRGGGGISGCGEEKLQVFYCLEEGGGFFFRGRKVC